MQTKYFIIILSLVAFFSCKKQESFENKWTKLSYFSGEEINGGASFAINGKIYVGWGACNYDFWEYSPANDSWSKNCDLSNFSDRKNPHYFVIDDMGFIFDGSPQCDLPKRKATPQLFMIFDPELKKWQAKEITNTEIYEYDTPLLTRSNKAVVINNSSYIMGLYNAFWEYNYVDDQWIQRDSFPGNSNCEISYAIGDKIYFGKPWVVYEGETDQEFWEYNIETGNWKRLNDFPGPFSMNATGFSINGKGYIMGGFLNPEPFKYQRDIWEYSPETDSWEKLGEMPLGKSDATHAVVIDNAVYFFLNSENPYEVWKFEP